MAEQKEFTSGDKVVVSVDGAEFNGEVRAVKPAVAEAGLDLHYVVSVDHFQNERVLTVPASDVVAREEAAVEEVAEEAPAKEEAPKEEESKQEAPKQEQPAQQPAKPAAPAAPAK